MRGMFVGSIRGVECLIRDKFANGGNNLLANGGPEKLGNRDSMLWSGYTHVPEYWPTGRLQKTQEGEWLRRISSNFPRFCGRACAKAQRLNRCPDNGITFTFLRGNATSLFSLLPHEHNRWNKASASHPLTQFTPLLYMSPFAIIPEFVVLGGKVGITSHHIWGKYGVFAMNRRI